MEYFAWSNLKVFNIHTTSAICTFNAGICFGSTLKNQSKHLFDAFQFKCSVLLCQKFVLNSRAKKQPMDNKERDGQKEKRRDEINPLLKLKGNTEDVFPSKENKKREKVCLFAGVGRGV